ncbi:MATE family efflux transporter [Paenibacillus sp. SYP-B3998]|uniref:MATE family efflux transporter n=2 Tax=Paenibacillus sp. SYP-B3998 TaxID=2678564 RepID=A0A6G4A5C1_9BACL|nr:MATE family efflux transporter [Paenibacillus sp. SYP-B3998]
MKLQERMQIGMFEGSIIPTIVKIGLPILIGNLLNYVYLIVDTYYIAMLDPSSPALLSGTGLLFPLIFVFEAIASSLAVGLSAVTGRLIGERKFEECKSLGISGVLMALLLGIPFIIICYTFGPDLIQLLAGSELSPEAATYGLQFLYSLAPGLIFMILLQVYGGILLGEGLTYVLAIAFMLMTVLNIILDPILIFVLKMGVAGAGLSTTISLCVALLYVIRFIQKGKARIPLTFSLSRFNGTIVKEIIRIGLPQFLMTVSIYVIAVVYNKIITTTFSENAMSAWTLTGRFDQILIIPIIAVAGATTVFVAQNYGRNQLERIKKALNVNLGFVMIMSTVIAVIYVFVAPWLFSKFTLIPEVVELATKQVLIISFTFGCMAITWVIGSFFQATGKPMPAVIILYIRVIIIIALGVYFIYVQKMGLNGIFISVAIGNVLSLPLSFFWIKRHLKSIKFESVLEN